MDPMKTMDAKEAKEYIESQILKKIQEYESLFPVTVIKIDYSQDMPGVEQQQKVELLVSV